MCKVEIQFACPFDGFGKIILFEIVMKNDIIADLRNLIEGKTT
jgi:hypothetical protein